jgi:hypothetical protein
LPSVDVVSGLEPRFVAHAASARVQSAAAMRCANRKVT